MTKYFEKLSGACSLSTAKVLKPELSEEEIERVFRKHGYTTKTPISIIEGALEELGFDIIEIKSIHDPCTLAQFCKRYPTGAFYVSTTTHGQAVIDGQAIDPYFEVPRMKSEVHRYYKIDNSTATNVGVTATLAALKDPTALFKLVVSPYSHTHSKKRITARLGLEQQGEFTVKTAGYVGYTKAILRFEIERGHIHLVGKG